SSGWSSTGTPAPRPSTTAWVPSASTHGACTASSSAELLPKAVDRAEPRADVGGIERRDDAGEDPREGDGADRPERHRDRQPIDVVHVGIERQAEELEKQAGADPDHQPEGGAEEADEEALGDEDAHDRPVGRAHALQRRDLAALLDDDHDEVRD